MGLFRRKREQPPLTQEKPPCLHMTLTACWDSVEDMGDESKATAFVCMSCNMELTPAEAHEARSSQAEQLRKDIA